MIAYFLRNVVGACVGFALRKSKSEFRFSKDYRWETTRLHSLVYRCVNTVAANYVADGDDIRVGIFWGFPRQSRYHTHDRV